MSLELTSTGEKSIDCLGDIISYSCSIFSNSETLHLIWRVSLPGLLPINIPYNMTSNLNLVEFFPHNISAGLTEYRKNMYIQSSINFKLSKNIDLDGTQLECGIASLSTESVRLTVSLLGMLYTIKDMQLVL